MTGICINFQIDLYNNSVVKYCGARVFKIKLQSSICLYTKLVANKNTQGVETNNGQSLDKIQTKTPNV